jgi:hypothetical protein
MVIGEISTVWVCIVQECVCVEREREREFNLELL